MQLLRHGDKVKILHSPYPHINAGDEGIVERQHLDGYGIAIEKYFPPIVSNASGSVQKRVMYFEPHEVEKVATLQS